MNELTDIVVHNAPAPFKHRNTQTWRHVFNRLHVGQWFFVSKKDHNKVNTHAYKYLGKGNYALRLSNKRETSKAYILQRLA